MLSYLFVGVFKIFQQVFDHLIFYQMVRALKALEDITAKADTNVIFDTIPELKDPNIRMQWFLVELMCLRIRMECFHYVKDV